jgi:hypothetical protein
MSADISATQGQELLRLLREQREVFRQLEHLAQRQKTLIIEDNPQPLLELLAERQRLVNRLVRLSRQSTLHRQRWPHLSEAMQCEDRRQADALMADINGMLEDILAADAHDCAALAGRKNALAGELNEAQVGQQATKAYRHRLNEPSVLDTTDTSA